MENFEQEELRQEPVEQEMPKQEQAEPSIQQPYHGAGAGRKESPFVNSPYVMNHEQPKAESAHYQNTYIPPIPPQEPPRRMKKPKSGNSRKVWKAVLCAVLAIVLVAGSCGMTAYMVNNKWESRTNMMIDSFENRMNQMQEQIDSAAAKQDNIIGYPNVTLTVTPPGAIYQNNVQAVVMITAKVTGTNIFGQAATGTSRGSGFVLTKDGYVVTNHHVVDKAIAVTVTMHDGTEYEAKIVGSDATNDVAVLKITETVQLQAVKIGSSDDLLVGEQVVAIGNALGELTSTLTVGYVSAKGRDINTEGKTINMIQTDAAINSGNSGGPLFNSRGEVVGITTAKYSGNSSSGASIEGIGFAIPIDDVMPLVNDLVDYGYINSAYLGVMISDVDASSASYYGLPVGAYVREVISGNCAEKAGLKAKDIIVAVGDYDVKNVSELTKVLRKFKAGEETVITVFRSGQELKLPITLDEKPHEDATPTPEVPENGEMPENGSYDDWYKYFFGPKG